MITLRLPFLLFILFITLLGGALFRIKYAVADLEGLHKTLRRDLLKKNEELHILKAEWAYLNEPSRLKELAQKYLSLQPINGEQLIPFEKFQNSNLGEYDRKELEKVLGQAGRHLNLEKK
jgi:hypothetical protein